MKRYRTIVADPPWRYTRSGGDKRTDRRSTGRGASAEHYYPTMTNAEIAALPLADLADDQAHLYVWVTNPVLTKQRESIMALPDVFDIARGWGFEPKAMLTWVKTGPPGLGWYFRGHTEHVVFATRGDLGIPAHARIPNVFEAPRGEHSAKPDLFLDLVEEVARASGAEPMLELFARRARFGWDYWGDQSLGTAEMGTEDAA